MEERFWCLESDFRKAQTRFGTGSLGLFLDKLGIFNSTVNLFCDNGIAKAQIQVAGAPRENIDYAMKILNGVFM